MRQHINCSVLGCIEMAQTHSPLRVSVADDEKRILLLRVHVCHEHKTSIPTGQPVILQNIT